MRNINSIRKRRFINYSAGVVLSAALLAGTALFLSRGNAAGKDSNPLLVSTSWLAEHIKDPGLVIVTVGPRVDRGFLNCLCAAGQHQIPGGGRTFGRNGRNGRSLVANRTS